MDKKALKRTAVIILSFFAFLFIITLSNGSVQVHQFAMHQTAIKGFAPITSNATFQWGYFRYNIINGSYGANTVLNLASHDKQYYIFGQASNGNGDTINQLFEYTNNQDSNQTYNTSNTIYTFYGENTLENALRIDIINSSNVSDAYSKPYDTYAMYSTGTIATAFLGTNSSLKLLSNSVQNYSFTAIANETYFGSGFQPIASTNLNCTSYNGVLLICTAKQSVKSWLNASTRNAGSSVAIPSDITVLTLIPQSYSFTSEFSYISPSGQIPICSLMYPLQPILSINQQSVKITPLLDNYSFNEQPFTNYQFNYVNSFQQLFISNSSLSTPLVYQSLNPSQITTSAFPVSIQNSFKINNTYIAVSKNQSYTMSSNNQSVVASLIWKPAYFSDQQLITIGRLASTTAVTPTLLYTLFNSSLLWGINLQSNTTNTAIFNHYLVSATNSTTYQNITLNLTMDIPLKDLTNSTLAIAPSVFNITQFLYYPALQSVNPNGSMLRISKVYPTILKPTFKIYTYANSSNQFLQLSMPQILTIEENTTGYTNTNLSVFFMVNALANLQFKYTLKNNTFTFSTFNPTPFNATFNSTNPTIVNPSNTEIYNETYVNASTIPNLFWSYAVNGKVPVTITSSVNGITFTQSTKFDIANKNYTSSANALNLSLNASTIYNGLAYFIYNNKDKVVKFSFTTAPFNPCLTAQALTKVNIATTIYVNGSTTTITKSNNKTTSNSSSTTTPTTPTTPTSIFTPQQTFFGKSFLNLGSFSWLATLGLYYLIGTFSVFLYIASKYKRTSQTLISYIVLGVLLVIGFGLGYVQSYIFALFMLILLVVVADTFRTLLTTRKG